MDLGKNNDEIQVKKRWLISFIVYNSFIYASVVIECALKLGKYGFLNYLSMAIGAVVVLAASAYFTYYCAYKKHGTIWLSLILLGLPLNFIKDIMESRKTSDGALLWYLIPGIFLTYFWVSCFNLRTLNKKLREINKKYRKRKTSDQGFISMEE